MSDNKSASIPLSGVWRATVSARRKEGLTKEEFSRRFARHGTLAGPVVVKHNGISYLQVCTIEDEMAMLKKLHWLTLRTQ